MARSAEQEFHREMIQGSARLKREISYHPVRFLQMVDEHGGVGAVQRLLRVRDTSDGFTTLWAAGRLNMSCEATALLPWYEGLFTEEETATARWRLTEHDFDVDSFLADASGHPPSGFDQGNVS